VWGTESCTYNPSRPCAPFTRPLKFVQMKFLGRLKNRFFFASDIITFCITCKSISLRTRERYNVIIFNICISTLGGSTCLRFLFCTFQSNVRHKNLRIVLEYPVSLVIILCSYGCTKISLRLKNTSFNSVMRRNIYSIYSIHINIISYTISKEYTKQQYCRLQLF
jgi:hypothetical protein